MVRMLSMSILGINESIAAMLRSMLYPFGFPLLRRWQLVSPRPKVIRRYHTKTLLAPVACPCFQDAILH